MHILNAIEWHHLVDFLVLAAACYWVVRWAKEARALRIALTTAALHAGALLTRHYDLVITSWVLDGAAVVTVVLLVVVFQTELRRALMRIDSQLRFWPRTGASLVPAHRVIAEAAFALARERAGALIVLVRKDSVTELIDGGVSIGAEVSAPLLRAVFQKTALLHDGAVIIDGGRVVRANAVLPLTQRVGVPSEYGTRHRAAMGLAERSDALVLAVSEERGEVTVMHGQNAQQIENPEELETLLQRLRTRPTEKLSTRLKRVLTARVPLKLTAAGLAAVFWGMSFLPTGTSVRIVTVPVEFSAVPDGMQIANQASPRLEIQLRGSSWLLDSMNLTRLVAHFRLNSATKGDQILRFEPGILDLPPGIVIENVSPPAISVKLVPKAPAK